MNVRNSNKGFNPVKTGGGGGGGGSRPLRFFEHNSEMTEYYFQNVLQRNLAKNKRESHFTLQIVIASNLNSKLTIST